MINPVHLYRKMLLCVVSDIEIVSRRQVPVQVCWVSTDMLYEELDSEIYNTLQQVHLAS